MKVHAVLCAVDADDADMLTPQTIASALDGPTDVLENGQRCPEECPPPSDLNGGV